MENMAYQWLVVLVGGIIILGLVIAYAMKRSARTTPREELRGEAGARTIYRAEDKGRDA
jgi:hypothetical protein